MPCSETTDARAPARSAGGLVVRDTLEGAGRRREILLVKHARRGTWMLPKGHVEPGEDALEAAMREVAEEAFVACEPVRELPAVEYISKEGRKEVRFWLMRPIVELPFEGNKETSERAWFVRAAAETLVEREHERAIVRTYAESPA